MPPKLSYDLHFANFVANPNGGNHDLRAKLEELVRHIAEPVNLSSHTSNTAISMLFSEAAKSTNHRETMLAVFATYLKLRHGMCLAPHEEAIAAIQHPLMKGSEFSVLRNTIQAVRNHPKDEVIAAYVPLVERAKKGTLNRCTFKRASNGANDPSSKRKLFLELLLVCPLRIVWLAQWLAENPETIDVTKSIFVGQLTAKMLERDDRKEKLFPGLDLKQRTYDAHTLDQKGTEIGALVNFLQRFYADPSIFDFWLNVNDIERHLVVKDISIAETFLDNEGKPRKRKLPFCAGALISQHLPLQLQQLGVYHTLCEDAGNDVALNSAKFLNLINSRSAKACPDKAWGYDDVAKWVTAAGFQISGKKSSSTACMFIRLLQSFLSGSALAKQRAGDNRLDELTTDGDALLTRMKKKRRLHI